MKINIFSLSTFEFLSIQHFASKNEKKMIENVSRRLAEKYKKFYQASKTDSLFLYSMLIFLPIRSLIFYYNNLPDFYLEIQGKFEKQKTNNDFPYFSRNLVNNTSINSFKKYLFSQKNL